LCDRCGSPEHVSENCQVGNPFASPHIEHDASVNNFQPRPNHDPYSNSTPSGRLPSKPEQNPIVQCNAIVLRSGTKLEGSKGIGVKVESEKEKDKGKTPLPHKSELEKKRENENEQESKTLPPKPYTPPLPFPQRFARTKLKSQFGKFLDMLKKLHVNVPFFDALSQMLLYDKFLKKSSPKRGKLMSMRLWPQEKSVVLWSLTSFQLS